MSIHKANCLCIVQTYKHIKSTMYLHHDTSTLYYKYGNKGDEPTTLKGKTSIAMTKRSSLNLITMDLGIIEVLD